MGSEQTEVLKWPLKRQVKKIPYTGNQRHLKSGVTLQRNTGITLKSFTGNIVYCNTSIIVFCHAEIGIP